MHHPTDRITHTTAFVTPVVEHWLEREIAQQLKTEPPTWGQCSPVTNQARNIFLYYFIGFDTNV